MIRIGLPQAIKRDYAGYLQLAELWLRCEPLVAEQIELDMSGVTWFDADLCAGLGALLYRLGEQLSSVRLVDLQPQVETIFRRNGFLSSYGRAGLPDSFHSTVPYQRFDLNDDRFFSGYLERELMHRPELPDMSPGLLKRLHESISEIFNNAVTHSQTQHGIYCCGQFFMSGRRLAFTIVDMGIGIPANVNHHTGLALAPEQAIVWATTERNTTRHGRIPGGLGLKLLREFIGLNGGNLSIVSGAGFWMQGEGGVSVRRMPSAFPGTIVSICFQTAGASQYGVAEDLPLDEIF